MMLYSNKIFYNFFYKCNKLIQHIIGFSNFDYVNSGEKYLINLIYKDIKSVIDVGAAEGSFFELIDSKIKNQFIYYGFEPNPDSFKILEASIRQSEINNFKIYNKAVGHDEKLNLHFYKSKTKPNHSSLI